MDKPISLWGRDAHGDKVDLNVEMWTQLEIDVCDSKYLRDIHQEALDKYLKEIGHD